MIKSGNPQCDELFDSIGQTIFGVGLHLEQILESTEDPEVSERLDASIRGLHDIIERIRNRGELHREDVPCSR